MGVVIPFKTLRWAETAAGAQDVATAADDERSVADAVRADADQAGVLAAANSLFERCRDRHGFVVMRDGLPQDPTILGRALIELSRGLTMLDVEMNAPRTYPMFGVYFGRRQLAWFEDGYSGATALAVPNDTQAVDLAAFVRPRVATTRSRSNR